MGQISYGPLLGPERGRPLMDRIKYGPAFGPKHGSQLMGWPTRVLKIVGLQLGRPINVGEI